MAAAAAAERCGAHAGWPQCRALSSAICHIHASATGGLLRLNATYGTDSTARIILILPIRNSMLSDKEIIVSSLAFITRCRWFQHQKSLLSYLDKCQASSRLPHPSQSQAQPGLSLVSEKRRHPSVNLRHTMATSCCLLAEFMTQIW